RACSAADVRRYLSDAASDLWLGRGDRRARLQSAARLHGPAVVRPFRLFRRGRLHRGVRGPASRAAFDGAVHSDRHPGGGDRVGAVRLHLRAPYPDLFRHPHADALAGDLQPGSQALLGDRRQRWAARAASGPPAGPAQLLGTARVPAVHHLVLLLCARHFRGLCRADVGDRAFAVRQDAAGHPRQRGPGPVSRHPDPPLSLDRIPAFRDLHWACRHPVGAAQRPDHARRPVLDVLGRDRIYRAARRLPQLYRPDRRRSCIHLSEGLHVRPDRILAGPARRGPGHPRAGVADRHCGRAGEPRPAFEAESGVILLKTVNLRKQFGETRACDGLDFVVHKGEFLSLVGSNGAGKTTLVNLISAQLQPDSGQVLLEDRDITYTSVAERIQAGIARSFQIVNLFDGLSVFDNVALSIFSREGKTVRMAALADHDYEVRDETLQVLEEFGLSDKAEVLAGGLAQGERKLLDVAVAYALRPRLLFLDEPTSGVSTRDKA